MIVLASGARSLLALAGLAWFGWLVFGTSRRRASESPRRRRTLLVGGALMVALGVASAFWLPHRVPDTPGSPAALVAILLLWLIGGSFLFVGIASLIGAALARGPAPQG